ncbi:MAG: type II toxin-antitoxin system RelE/ParE family toxin [Bacteroidales bacterium]|nr:type II toxin-antitoxin system RelE/ParE family toxin [Bacteroidales bacterium]
MDGLRIFWTQTAINQRNLIFEYWNKRNQSKAYSQKLNKKIKERIKLLKVNPFLGKKTDYNQAWIISLGHYSIVYRKIYHHIIIIGF